MVGLDAARKNDAPVVFDRANRKKAGNVSEAAGAPAPWKQNIRGPTSVFAKRAKKAGIDTVVFDRGGYRYAAQIKALADAAREGGLAF